MVLMHSHRDKQSTKRLAGIRLQIDFKVIQNRNEYIVIRKRGAYEQHAHIPKKSMVKLLLSLIENNRLPKGRYLKGSCRRRI